MEIYGSFLRLTYDPDDTALVLLDYGADMWGAVKIDGEQVVQVQNFIRAVGIKAIARGNESHTLSFEKCRVKDGLADALADRINGILALPRATADILISLQDGRQWRLKNAAVRTWPGGQEDHLTREGVTIIGGELSADAGVYIPGMTWGEIALEWESLG